MSHPSGSNPWLVVPTRNPRAAIRLFCFHYAGGSAVLFHRWAASLPPFVEVCAIQLPGRGTRQAEPPLTTIEAVIGELGPAIRPYLDIPFVFFGHSMGALIGFELTRHIQAAYGLSPEHLFASGRCAPQMPIHTAYHLLSDDAFLERLRDLNGTPPAILEDAELMRHTLPILRADFTICETYRYAPQPPLACPISAFGGLRDPDVSYEHLLDWRQQTVGPFHVHMFPGDHFFVNSARVAVMELIIRAIQQYVPGTSYAA